MILHVKIRAERVLIGERFSVSFQRTQRVKESLHTAGVTPSWGALPVQAAPDFLKHTSNTAHARNTFVIPVGAEEAVWLGFAAASWRPNALKVGVGGRNAISGEKWDQRLRASPQDYLVCPPQLSLEGMCAEDGSILQIMPDSESTDDASWEANLISLIVYEPKKGVFAEEPPKPAAAEVNTLQPLSDMTPDSAKANTLARRIAGGVHRDPYGIDSWDTHHSGSLFVYMVGPERYKEITGREPPPHPSDRDIYQGNYLP